jgi:uncharacterized RDD family membrane protein YckC
MNIDDHRILEAPPGYISEEAKKKFTLLAGILGALFFLGQIVIPFAAMAIFMPFMFLSGFEIEHALVKRGAYWNGRVWYPQKIEKSGPRGQTASFDLWTLTPDSTTKPEKAMEGTCENAWLLADNDKLWILSSKSAGYFKDGKITNFEGMQQLGEISRPFLYKGLPAVVEERPGGQRIKVLVNHRWEGREAFRISPGNSRQSVVQELAVLPLLQKTYFFLKYNDSLYYRESIPTEKDNWDDWKPVCDAYNWTVAVIEDEPVVFCTSYNSSYSGKIRGLRLHDEAWEEFFSKDAGWTSDLGVYPLQARGSFLLLIVDSPGRTTAINVKGNVQVSETQFGDGLFPKAFFSTMVLMIAGIMLMPLMLAFVLSRLMEKYRLTYHKYGDMTVKLASLWQRTAAHAIDSLLVGWPIIVGYVTMFMNMERMQNPSSMFMSMGMIFFGFSLLFLGLVLYSFTEGKWGLTPGKWLVGIRTYGTDLMPCGFGRAFIRNILRFVDSSFNFIVGIMMVALTENWQRLGDLAARTVVVVHKKG